MNKKIILLSLCAIGAFFSSCSDDATASNPQGIPDSGTSFNPPIDTLVPAPQDPVIDPITGEVIPPTPQDPSDSVATAPGIPGFSSSIVPGETILSSSSITPIQSSSSGLKEYDDNHLPKESFLPAAGFYTNLTIDPPTSQKGGEIKCTFDGSFPTLSSQPITAARQITQNTVIRCSEFVNGQPADTTTQTYFINETVSMPVVALTVNHFDMFDSTAGLYATGPGPYQSDPMNASENNNPKCQEPCKGANFWKDDELPVHVEFFENGSASKAKNWEIDAGISIIGNYSRYKPKKSVAIKMDNDIYGDKVLKYSLFKTRPEAKKFKSFNLRNNGNRFWTDYFGDAMLVSLMEGTEVDYQRSRQVVVFYNGEYFGIHDMRERLNRSFAETNYGIDSKSINVVKNCGSGDNNCSGGWAPSGTNGASADEFAQLVNSITSGNFDGENNQNYAQLSQKMNISSFAQYMVAEMYIHNGDWPGNNIRTWGSPNNGQPFKFMIFDVDHGYGFTPGISGFDAQSQNMFSWVLGSTTLNSGNNQGGNQGGGFGGMFGGMGGWNMGGNSTVGKMLSKLLANPDFKRLFINQACILLDNYLTYAKVQTAVQNMAATIPSSEQIRDEQRFPRNQSNFNWAPSGSDLLKFGQNRTETFKQELMTYFGLSNEVSVTLGVNGSGQIFVDGMKLPNGSYQGKFFEGNRLQLNAVPSAGRVFAGWSDGSSENPHLISPANGITITANFK